MEIGPDGTLTAMAQGTLDPDDALTVPALRKDRPEPEALLAALAQVFVKGVGVDWAGVFDGAGARSVDLPTYAFQRQRFWPKPPVLLGDVGAVGLRSADHPLLGAAVQLAGADQFLFTGRLSLRSHPWLADHALTSTALFPATGFVELALHAADQVGCACVEELTIVAPLVLPAAGAVRIQLRVDGPDASGARPVNVYSRLEDAPEEQPWSLNVSGLLTPGEGAAPQSPYDFTVWPPKDATEVPLDGFYERFAERGHLYGPLFQGLKSVWLRGEEVFADVALPEAADPAAGAFDLHPALLDAALHAVMFVPMEDAGRLPFSWNGVRVDAVGAGALRLRMVQEGPEAVSLAMADAAGQPLASVGSLTLRELTGDLEGSTVGAPRHDALFEMDWAPVKSSAAPAQGALTLVGGGSANELREALGTADLRAHVHADLAALADSDADVPETVLFAVPASPGSGDLAAATHEMTHQALEFVQRWLDEPGFYHARLAVITRDAMNGGSRRSDPVQAAVWGLVRAARSENPGRFVLIDTDGSVASAAAIPDALASGEPELAISGGTVTAARISRLATDGVLNPPAETAAWRLGVVEKGTLESLRLTECPDAEAPLAPREVRIAVRAAGVNFRDVLTALGMYPGDATAIGLEGAGVMPRSGAQVTGLAPGDRVMGMFSGAFGPLAIADERMVARIPRGWSFAQAATVPIVYLTAYHGLVDLGELTAGQSVLIHAAAGGVGIAAVQLARHLGAEVFGTAGPGKWDALRAAGLDDEHIASSRDPGLREGVLRRHRRPGRGRGARLARPASSWTPRCGCCRAAAGSWRWARPTSATRARSQRTTRASPTRRSTSSTPGPTGSARCWPNW